MSKLAQQYYDNVLSGDIKQAESVRNEIDEHVKAAQATSRVHPSFVNTILNDNHTPAIHVYEFLNDRFKDEWWDWEIETIEHAIWRDYGLVLSDMMADKIQSIKLLLNNQRPFLDWWYFNQVCHAFCGTGADFTSIKSPSPGMAVSTMRTMQAMRPEENFSRDVKKYVCLLLIGEGIYTPPPSISGILLEEFEALVSQESKVIWPKVLNRCAEMIDDKEYGESDDPVEIQARRLLIVEHASNKFGG